MEKRSTVSLAIEPPLATVTFSRPPVNALDIEAIRGIQTRLEETAAHPHLKLVALAGAGADFSAGTDVGGHRAGEVETLLPAFHSLIRTLLTFEVPTVALVQGRALGGGAELALACDFVFAERTSTFGFPEIRLGVFPPVASVLLERRIGRARAADLILCGAAITGEQAAKWGLLNVLLEHGELIHELHRMRDRLAPLSAMALHLAKRALVLGTSADPLKALEKVEALYLGDLMKTRDAHEGIAAFLEKRPPNWKDS